MEGDAGMVWKCCAVLCDAVRHLSVRQLFTAAGLQDAIAEGGEKVCALELASISVDHLSVM